MLHRLILTSSGLSGPLAAELSKWLGDQPQSKSMWYIPTAPLRDGWSKSQAEQQMAITKQELGIGKCAWIDVEYTKGEELRAQVDALGSPQDLVIYAEMGNTYNLCHHLWNSGGAELIKELMDQGAIYVGASAGSIMAGKTCQMALWKNWDDQTCEGTVSVDWNDKSVAKGLDLAAGRSIFPHANGQYASKEWQNEQARKHGHTDHEVIPLADGHGVVIEGDRIKLM